MTVVEPKQKARWIVEAALDRKAERPLVLDMAKLIFYADTFVLLTGRSDRQVRAIAEGILEVLRARGEAPLAVEGMADGYWVLIDCNDAIVHIFDPEARAKFDLERLWQDAPRIDLGIEGVESNPAPEHRTEGEDAADPAA